MLLKNPKSKMLQFGLLGGCCAKIKINPPCLLRCCHIGSSFVMCTLALSYWIKLIEGPSFGHFLNIAWMRFCMSMFLQTFWVTDTIGLISIDPLNLFFESLTAATLLIKGKIPISPSNVHWPCGLHHGLATAPRNMAFNMNLDDFVALHGIFSLCAR